MAITRHLVNPRSSVRGKTPRANEIEYGEIAVNYNAKEPFLVIKDSNSAITRITDDVVAGQMTDSGFTTVTWNEATSAWTVVDSAESPTNNDHLVNGKAGKIYLDVTEEKAYAWDNVTKRFKLVNGVNTNTINYEGDGNKYIAPGDNLTDGLDEMANSLSGKQDIDDVLVDQAYFAEHGVNTFANDNKRYNVVDSLTLESGETYVFGSECILHFFNEGELNGEANLQLNNTQIEAPMKKCFGLDVTFTGLMQNSECYPEWWGAVGDGENDDADAINRCIFNAGRTTVVMAAENYLVKSTIGCEKGVANVPLNLAGDIISASTSNIGTHIHVKNNIIGDESLADAVIRFNTDYSKFQLDGSIIVKNPSDDCIGFTTFPSPSFGSGYYDPIGCEIHIHRIMKEPHPFAYMNGDDNVDSKGKGVGIVYAQFYGTLYVDAIGGFEHGVYLSRTQSCLIHVGLCEAVYTFFVGTPKDAWRTGWTGSGSVGKFYVTRNKIHLAAPQNGSSGMISRIADSSIIREDGEQEIALNEWTLGDSNNSNGGYRHPHAHTLYYTAGAAQHTGNKYNINITYGTENTASKKFIKMERSTAPTSAKSCPNGDTFNFGISCYLKDIDIDYAWNVKLNNVLVSNTAKTKGSYRWGITDAGTTGHDGTLIDTITVTNDNQWDATGLTWSAPTKTIFLLDINKQSNWEIVPTDTVPTTATCENCKFYVVDNSNATLTNNNTKKYPIYCNYFGSGATLIGYSLDNYREKQDVLVSGTNIKTVNGKSIVGSGNAEINAKAVIVVERNGDFYSTDWDGSMWRDDISTAISPEENVIYVNRSTYDTYCYMGGQYYLISSSQQSDIKLKENVDSISDEDLEKASGIRFVSYNFKSDDTKRKRYGVIAQEIQDVNLGELVTKFDENTLGVDYFSLLCLKVKQLEKEIEELKDKLGE